MTPSILARPDDPESVVAYVKETYRFGDGLILESVAVATLVRHIDELDEAKRSADLLVGVMQQDHDDERSDLEVEIEKLETKVQELTRGKSRADEEEKGN